MPGEIKCSLCNHLYHFREKCGGLDAAGDVCDCDLILWGKKIGDITQTQFNCWKNEGAALCVKRLRSGAKLPTVTYMGSDLGYDVYAVENTWLPINKTIKVPTGIAIAMSGYGFKVFDRSSVSLNDVITCGGVIDEQYRGEVFVNMRFLGDDTKDSVNGRMFWGGEKIAQLVPFIPLTKFPVLEVEELSTGTRGTKGYGSSGK